VSQSRRGTLWLVSIAFSLILLGLVVAQIDWNAAKALATKIAYDWIALGITLLLFEGFITAARFRLMARTAPSYGDCLSATAWYVLMLIGLPARLGEVAGIALIVKYMRERAGTAAASLLFQRLFDLIVLALLLAVFGVVLFSGSGVVPILSMIAAVILTLIVVMIFLEDLLAIAVRPALKRRREKWPRRMARLLLQARMFRRHHMDRARTMKLGGYTLMKWIVNLSAVACVVLAVVPVLPLLTAIGVGIVYNLSAVIPIQTVGGFGITEAALLGSFSWLGYSLEVGAPIAIAIRLALVSGPILFWLAIVTTVGRRAPTSPK
jgi:uncharacterized membrane protein YbhN (UPF0104 family)